MSTPLSSSMTAQRRAEIRDLLTEQVARDAAASPPAVRRMRRPLAAGAVVAATAVAIFVAGAVGSPPASYASWTAVPQTAPGAPASDHQIHRWASTCTDLGVGGLAFEGVPTDRTGAALRHVLVDRRGSFTYCLDVAIGTVPGQTLVALSGIRADHVAGLSDSLNTMWGTVYDKPVPLPRGHDVLVLGGDLREPTPDPSDDDPSIVSLRAYQLYGLAGPGVESVRIALANGTTVTATVQHGLWGAWWPADKGSPSGTVLRVGYDGHQVVVDPRKVALFPS